MTNEALDFSLAPENPPASVRNEADVIVRKVFGSCASVQLLSKKSGVTALQRAIAARCPFATRTLWEKVDSLCGIDWYEAPHTDVQATLVGGNLACLIGKEPFSIELLRFLVCYARTPTLVMAVFKQLGFCPMDHFTLDWDHDKRSGQGSVEDRANGTTRYWSHNVSALLATIMVGITHSRHPPKGSSVVPVEVDPAWDRLLAFLLRNACVHSIKAYTIVYATRPSSHTPCAWSKVLSVRTTLLEVAIACSKTTGEYVDMVLDTFKLTNNHSLKCAFCFALNYETGVGDAVLLEVLRKIYQQLLSNRASDHGSGYASSTGTVALMRCWQEVVGRAPAVMTTQVCVGTEVEPVLVPYDESGKGCPWPPELFLEIVDMMYASYLDGVSTHPTEDELEPLLVFMRSALPTVLTGPKAYMANKLINEIYRNNNDPTFLLCACDDLLFKLSCFEIQAFEKIAAGLDVENEYHACKLGDALFMAITRGFLRSARQLLDVLGKVPDHIPHPHTRPAKEVFKDRLLLEYVDTMARDEATISVDRCHSPAIRAARFRDMKEHFVHFLDLGKPWKPEELARALARTGRVQGGVAVGVLVSPPYCVPMPENDCFVAHIMRNVLAPGAHMVLDAQSRFATSAL